MCGRCVGAENGEFVHGEVDARNGLVTAGTELAVWVVLDEAKGNGFGYKGTKPAMVCLDGIVGKGAACAYSSMVLQPIIEEVDVGEGDVIEGADDAERLEKVAEEAVLTECGGGAAFFFCAFSAEVKE